MTGIQCNAHIHVDWRWDRMRLSLRSADLAALKFELDAVDRRCHDSSSTYLCSRHVPFVPCTGWLWWFEAMFCRLWFRCCLPRARFCLGSCKSGITGTTSSRATWLNCFNHQSRVTLYSTPGRVVRFEKSLPAAGSEAQNRTLLHVGRYRKGGGNAVAKITPIADSVI